MDTTDKRLRIIEKLLNWEIGFKIHNVINGRYYVDDIIPKMHESSNVLVTYPYSWEFYGNSYGGSYRSIKDAAKIILKLIRDNHDITIQEIWDKMSIHPDKKGQIVTIMFPESEELYNNETFSGTIFTDAPSVVTRSINEEHQRKRSIARTIIAKIFPYINSYEKMQENGIQTKIFL